MGDYYEDEQPYDDGYDDGPQVVPPADDRAAAILDGFRMCAAARFAGKISRRAREPLSHSAARALASQRLDEHVGRAHGRDPLGGQPVG